MSMCSNAAVLARRVKSSRPLPLVRLSWLVAILWGVASVAVAAEPKSKLRYGRKVDKVRTRGELDAKFKKALKEAEEAKRNGNAPSMTGVQLPRKRTDITLAAIDAQLLTMRALIEEAGPDDKEYPEFLFRYADLHLDRKAILEDQAGALFERIHELKEAGKKDAAKQARAKQAKLQRMAKEASESAAKAYGALAGGERWSKWHRMDEALYYYAFELGQLGREAKMQEVFVQLLRDHPTSRFVPQVFISFGDQRFEAGKVDDALALYQKVIDGYKDSPVYAYAVYKSAWCYLNPVGTAEPDYARALERFVATVEATLEGRAGSEANGAQLRRDARRDMVLAYVHAAKPSKAWDFFGKVGRGPTADQEMRREMMVRLAATYFGEGMYVESTATYHRLRDELPEDADRCEWQYRVVINALATDDPKIQWKETQALSLEWEQMSGSDQPKRVRKGCRDHAHDSLQRMATVWHEEGDKTHRPEIFSLADQAYGEYLKRFPKSKSAYEMQYWHGELLWQYGEMLYDDRDRSAQERGRAMFRSAHDAFVRSLEMKPKGKHSGEAAYAQMLSMKNYLEYDETGGKGRACKPQSDGTCVYATSNDRRTGNDERLDASDRFPIKPYTEDETLMLEAYARFEKYAEVAAKAHPEEAPKILFHRAVLMVEHNRFDEARPVLEALIEQHDGTVFSVWGAEMLIDTLTIAWADTQQTPEQMVKSGKELETWVRRLETMKLYRHAQAKTLREHAPSLLASIGWREAENCHAQAQRGEQSESFGRCARLYLDIYDEHEDHDRADELLFNAARSFEAGHEMGNAILARNALLEHHPESTLAKQTLREVGENYHAIAFYDRAAQRYEQYAEQYQGDDYSGTALENAFLFRLGLGQSNEAADDLKRYEGLYRRKDPKRAAGIFWARHDLLADPDEQLKHAEDYIQTYGKRGGADRLAVAHATAGQVLWRRSCPKTLLGDVCASIKRERATVGEDTRQQAADLRRRNGRAAIPKRCGTSTQGVITVHRRDPKLAAAAQKHFDRVLTLAKRAEPPADDADRATAYRDAVGSAMVYRTDARYEEYLRIEMPENLDFYIEEWKKGSGLPRYERQYRAQVARVKDTRERLQAFLDSKTAIRDELIGDYGKVLDSGSPHWVLASAARSAVVFQTFADQLYRAEVPRTLKTEEAYDDYCFGLGDYAQPLQEAATNALRYCLERSTKYQYFNEFSRMCEEELQQRSPGEFPATNEIFGESEYTRARLDVAGVQLDL
ncbi:MAG: hypothetical protein AAF799_06850 [Myxococcota bacterium]